ncbi:MAG: 1,4-dihydroxy-2-naphthoate octaprenyltransferase [Muribaculaceae bacterium]|nr:1,4-dihydroxy-2-naphthoate octaprenyltransferase [Muribaculaceae bacterium]
MGSTTVKSIKAWVAATRLHTLPVSVAGVIGAMALSMTAPAFRWLPGVLCLVFAILCQVASNFANEYFDWRAGLDRPGREGFRRGVTEGDISPRAMLVATIVTLSVACCVGLALIPFGGWWLIGVGVVVALGALAYSAGPYPLSHHGLGEVAVIVFFGIVPVTMTYYLMTGSKPTADAVAASVAIGLMGANVLIVNNYRDIDDDRAAGKRTLAVKFGRTAMETLYLFNGYIAIGLMVPFWSLTSPVAWIIPGLYLVVHTILYFSLVRHRGAALNPLLGKTALAMVAYCAALFLYTLLR